MYKYFWWLLAVYLSQLNRFVLASSETEIDENIWELYQKCDADWTNASWICDPIGLFSNESISELESVFTEVHTQTPCFCDDTSSCYRYEDVPIKSGFAAALLVVDSLPENLTLAGLTVEAIYKQSQLPRDDCDNGILIVYGITNYTFLTYRGSVSYITLSEEEELEILDQATMRMFEADEKHRAVKTMIRQYTMKLGGKKLPEFVWQPWIGFVIACIIAGLVLCTLIAICCSGICGKSKQERLFGRIRKVQESYYTSNCRSEDPIYVISEPACSADSPINSSTDEHIMVQGSSLQRCSLYLDDQELQREVQKKECFISE